MSQRKLAEALLRRGELEAARSVQEQVLEVHARVLGEHHLDTLHSRKQLAGTLHQQAILADHGVRDTDAPESLASMIAMLQGMIEREQYRQAGELAEHLKSCLLRPGVPGKLRKRGMAQLKRLYKLQGDLDALFALQEDEVQALEGALSEAGIEQR